MSFLSRLFTSSTPEIFSIAGRITCYGYPEDTTPDSASAGTGKFTFPTGAWDNRLVDHVSLAVSRDIEAILKDHGVRPRSAITLYLADSTQLSLRWDDRTASSYNGHPLVGRFDLYCAIRPSRLLDVKVIGFSVG